MFICALAGWNQSNKEVRFILRISGIHARKKNQNVIELMVENSEEVKKKKKWVHRYDMELLVFM